MRDYSLKKSPHDEGSAREKIPQGFYEFQITDYKEKDKEGNYLETKNGDPKVWVICEVVNSKDSDGLSCIHTLVFYKPDSPSIKGIGMTRHFLKTIGEDWEGDINPNPDNWIGKRFKAEVMHENGYVNLVDIQEADIVDPKSVKSQTVNWD